MASPERTLNFESKHANWMDQKKTKKTTTKQQQQQKIE